MKAGIVTVLALAASASAQIRRGERHHRHAHPKREPNNVVVETQVQYVTATAPHAIVYVDGNGNPISTGYDGQKPAATPAPYQAPAPAAAPEKEPAKEPAKEQPAPQPYSPPAPKPQPQPSKPVEQPKPKPQPSAPSYGGGSGSGSGSGLGITYSPYQAGGGCKSQDEVNSDFEKISGYSMIRLYGVDCNQVTTVMNAAKGKGMKLFVGIFDVTQASTEAQTLIDAVKGDWSMIDTVSVGNEWVNGGKGSADQVVGAMNSVRGQLKGAGYNGHVVTVDTFVAIIANPTLCQNSDYAAANCHAFFDGGRTADQAGSFVKEQAERVKQACGGKRTVITESGWPWKGEANGVAIPSRENQQTALSGLKSNFDKDMYLYTAFDDMWKTDFSGSFNCEKYWGFLQ